MNCVGCLMISKIFFCSEFPDIWKSRGEKAQLTVTCSNLTKETLEKGVKHVQNSR